MKNDNLLKCQFCGYLADIEEFDLDNLKQGYWCNVCDGYSYFSNKNSQKHKFTLILEGKSNVGNINVKPSLRLNKRLSPLRYPGGKSKLSDYLYSKLQESKTDIFVEAFAGGASVGLSLLNAGVIKHLVVNDLDFGIYSLFYTIKESPNLLINKLKKYTPTHEDYFKFQETILTNYRNKDLLEAAWCLLVVNRLAFSGICRANPIGGKNGSLHDFTQRWNPDELIKRILKINQMKDNMTVLNIDACELIEEMYWYPSTTILVDPPYYKKGKQLYNFYYRDEDHIKLSLLLDCLYQGCPGADIILTYDNDKFIERLYQYPDIENISRRYSI